VLTKALSGDHLVIVDDAKSTKAHTLRIVVIGKAKSVTAFYPAVIGITARVCCMLDRFHNLSLYLFGLFKLWAYYNY
jgi:hypothetical protein